MTSLSYFTVKQCFLMLHSVSPLSQFVPIASHPFTVHHLEDSGSGLFTPSFHLLVRIKEVPLSHLFFRLNDSSSFSLSSYVKCSNPSVILVDLHWIVSSVSMSLLYWGTQVWAE